MFEVLQSDKVLNRTLFNHFGKVLVFVFVSEATPASQELVDSLEATIPLFGEFENVKYFLIRLEQCPETFKKFQVEKTPTVVFTRTDKKVLRRFEEDDAGIILDGLAIVSEEERVWFEAEKAVWHPKIKSILEQSQVIVFIKGTESEPKCGFTETMLEILRGHQVEFAFYDIIADEYMRYWLRNYSGWPTYPQLHAQGKLVGGLDFCKELIAKGEFNDRIAPSSRVPNPSERL
jgi:Grx4 family monothiol glutaredoxin